MYFLFSDKRLNLRIRFVQRIFGRSENNQLEARTVFLTSATVIRPFVADARSADFCLGVMPPSALLGCSFMPAMTLRKHPRPV